MHYCEAPNHPDQFHQRPWLFLAGGITNCRDWQSELIELLLPNKGTIFNPRRKEWPINNPSASEEQIKWEYKYLWQADIISFWFSKETLNPIVLYELGAHLVRIKSKQAGPPIIIIGIEDGYQRTQDIIIQTSLIIGKDIANYINRSISRQAEILHKILQHSRG
jgi:hypothetical protein